MTTSRSIDSFHRGRFHVVQPLGQGHRSGMDAMLLASLIADERPIRVVDLGAGAGAAGMAVASRLENATVILVERSPTMAEFARQSLILPENARFARVSLKGCESTTIKRQGCPLQAEGARRAASRQRRIFSLSTGTAEKARVLSLRLTSSRKELGIPFSTPEVS